MPPEMPYSSLAECPIVPRRIAETGSFVRCILFLLFDRAGFSPFPKVPAPARHDPDLVPVLQAVRLSCAAFPVGVL